MNHTMVWATGTTIDAPLYDRTPPPVPRCLRDPLRKAPKIYCRCENCRQARKERP